MNQPNTYLGLIALLALPLGGAGKAELPQGDEAEIQGLIRKLGSDNFRERETASRGLAAIGEAAEHDLRRAMRHNDPEVRRRSAELVEALVARKRSREMAALQGVWILKTAEYLGEKADQDPTDNELEKLFSRQQTPAEERELVEDNSRGRTTLAFKGGTFENRQWIIGFGCGKGYLRSIEGTYDLDVDRSPKVMKRRWQEHGVRDEIHLRYCIYSLQSDTLLMCFSLKDDPRCLPTRFATTEDYKALGVK
jgi:uncharacterized protein (TIGR03067 family)